MKIITITVNVDGNEVTRKYSIEQNNRAETWGEQVEDMLDTLEKSDKPFKEIPGFEGTMDKLNEF